MVGRPIKKQDIIYCVGYKSGKSTILYTSRDMVNYIPYVELDFPIEEKTNEATIRFDSLGNAFMIIRSDKKKKGSYLGKSKFPYTEWEWEELDKFIGGPNMVLYKDRIFVLGRVYLDEDNKKKGTKTALAEIINKKVNVLKIFKSRGDTGYPGIILNGDILSISYYSAHIQNKDSEIKQKPIKGTAIYFSEINLSTF